jgi:hypothetical protein
MLYSALVLEPQGAVLRLRRYAGVLSADTALRGWLSDSLPVAIAMLAAAFYVVAGPDQGRTDGFFPLAQSMLHGSLSIDSSRPWIELVPAGGQCLPLRPDCQWYLPFPPIPAVVLMPIVALFGIDFVDTSGMAGLVGGINVLLVWLLVRRFTSYRAALALTIAFAFGSEAMYVAATGGIHLWVETLGMCFALAALVLAVHHKAPLAGGALLLLAAGCRPPYLLAVPAFFLIYTDNLPWGAWRSFSTRAIDAVSVWKVIRPSVLFCVGALPVGLFLLWYNVARFGTPLEFGYDRIISAYNGDSVLSEPWYSHGIVAVNYLPSGLYTMLLRSFDNVDQFPWFRPSWAGTSILITMPFLLYLTKAAWPSRLVLAGWLGALLPLSLDLMHGNPGYAQFGYRFILDAFPFMWLLLALVAQRYGVTRRFLLAILAGIAVNFYGLWCIATDFVGS